MPEAADMVAFVGEVKSWMREDDGEALEWTSSHEMNVLHGVLSSASCTSHVVKIGRRAASFFEDLLIARDSPKHDVELYEL